MNRPRSGGVDETLDVLADPRRRHALYFLRLHEEASVDELADVVAGWLAARDDAVGRVTPAERDRVRTMLYHVHVPKLVDAGLVTSDADSEVVALVDLPTALARLLDAALALEDSVTGETIAAGQEEG